MTVPLLKGCSMNVGALDLSNVTHMLDVCTCQCNNASARCEVFTGPNAALTFAEENKNSAAFAKAAPALVALGGFALKAALPLILG